MDEIADPWYHPIYPVADSLNDIEINKWCIIGYHQKTNKGNIVTTWTISDADAVSVRYLLADDKITTALHRYNNGFLILCQRLKDTPKLDKVSIRDLKYR